MQAPNRPLLSLPTADHGYKSVATRFASCSGGPAVSGSASDGAAAIMASEKNIAFRMAVRSGKAHLSMFVSSCSRAANWSPSAARRFHFVWRGPHRMRLFTPRSGSRQAEAQNFRQSFAVAARGRRETFELVTLGYSGSTERGTCSAELSVVFDQGEIVLPSLPAHKKLEPRGAKLPESANVRATRQTRVGCTFTLRFCLVRLSPEFRPVSKGLPPFRGRHRAATHRLPASLSGDRRP